MASRQTAPLSQQIADKLLNDFRSAEKYGPGDKLPNENDLSEEYGISRGTLREAIRILTAGGVLEVKRGIGTFVSSTLPESPATDLIDAVNSKARLKELYDFRLIMEPETAVIACKNATDDELKEIQKLSDDFTKAVYNNGDRLKADQLFHSAIAKATHNSVIYDFTDKIQLSISENEEQKATSDLFEEWTISDHDMITYYLQHRDSSGVRSAMRMHMLHLIQRIK